MNRTQIEKNINKLVKNFVQEDFIYDFLLAFGTPKSTITRLKGGNNNLSNEPGEITLKNKIHFKEVLKGVNLLSLIEELKESKVLQRHKCRFIIVTDFEEIAAVDTKTKEQVVFSINELENNASFFFPLAGLEKSEVIEENPADRKAAEKMAKLYDALYTDNKPETKEDIHNLNVFLSRLLFCFFAEDTGIFEKESIFTKTVQDITNPDGSDLNVFLDELFEILNEESRENVKSYFKDFPYVNGGLFKNMHTAPKFSIKSRKLLIECGLMDWKGINPDIFGSMIQAVVDPKHRGGLGMHYTSVPNIMKVIKPLFLDELKAEFEKGTILEGKKKNIHLQNLLVRLSKIRIFDPACGSGNFLIIAYKELCKLEMTILSEMEQVIPSEIKLNQFYGIELDDFAHEIAILSLWLAMHQINVEFEKRFGRANNILPLKDGGNIVHGNAVRIDWNEVCPKDNDIETYILGNPPYLGARYQEDEHREDIEWLLKKDIKNYKRLDYISCWFYKSKNYILMSNTKAAFVSTNSICQGAQAVDFWPSILDSSVFINFAYTSFKWANNAKGQAGVTCVIIGLSKNKNETLKIYSNNSMKEVKSITSYLEEGKNSFIVKQNKPISADLYPITRTNPALDDGNFLLNEQERQDLVKEYPSANKIIKKVVGAAEFIRGLNKYCLWIKDEELSFANSIPPIKDRIEKVRQYRLERKNTSTKNPADTPHQFLKMKMAKESVLFIPTVSSERREYIPVGFLDSETVIIDPNFAIYDPEEYIFGIISSRMHMVWVRAVAGRLKTDYRYSSTLCYNTFPFPKISTQRKNEITRYVYEVLQARENHSGKTLAQLYDPDKMPEDLRHAHRDLDLAIDRCYRSHPFKSDEDRLEYLFKMYEEMTKK
tara:strand:+ start:2110 stop:4761 length:2652 start_codon:yes stop_codon:yes gene_type:complete